MASKGRTSACGPAEARVRATQARKFLDTTELILGVDDDLAPPGTAAALAVLAGIAASDAVCCLSLGSRARGQDHHQATAVLAQVAPDGRAPSRALARLLEVKDGAHYGVVYLTPARAKTALRNATALTETAESALRR